MTMTTAEIRDLAEHSLTTHPPQDSAIIDLFEGVRPAFKEAFIAVHTYCPVSREASIAITNIEQALMWAIKAIAVHQDDILADIAAEVERVKEAAAVAARGKA